MVIGVRPSFASHAVCAGGVIVKNGMTTSNTSSASIALEPCFVAKAGGEDTSSMIIAVKPCSIATAGGEDTSSVWGMLPSAVAGRIC